MVNHLLLNKGQLAIKDVVCIYTVPVVSILEGFHWIANAHVHVHCILVYGKGAAFHM